MLPYRNEENIPNDELYIGHLAVTEKFRRQGIGLKLLEHAEEKAREKGLPKLSLLTEIENSAARALYEKYGFRLNRHYSSARPGVIFPVQQGMYGWLKY